MDDNNETPECIQELFKIMEKLRTQYTQRYRRRDQRLQNCFDLYEPYMHALYKVYSQRYISVRDSNFWYFSKKHLRKLFEQTTVHDETTKAVQYYFDDKRSYGWSHKIKQKRYAARKRKEIPKSKKAEVMAKRAKKKISSSSDSVQDSCQPSPASTDETLSDETY